MDQKALEEVVAILREAGVSDDAIASVESGAVEPEPFKVTPQGSADPVVASRDAWDLAQNPQFGVRVPRDDEAGLKRFETGVSRERYVRLCELLGQEPEIY